MEDAIQSRQEQRGRSSYLFPEKRNSCSSVVKAEHKHLGMILDSKLSFQSHVREVIIIQISRRAQEHAKSRHHFTVKSVAKLLYSPHDLENAVESTFQQFMTVSGDCSISKTTFEKKNR